jgi:predicted dehydrogenase
MEKIRWGILGAAAIAVDKIIPALQQSSSCLLEALASRSLKKARLISDRFRIPKAYDSYEALLRDKEIDAVYIPLPNSLHVEWSVHALHAGKHVLCEKPIGINATEVKRLADAAARLPELKIMEAFMYRFHPQWQKVREIIRTGQIGELRQVHSIFSFFDEDPSSILNIEKLGGGSLLDIGCYGISLSRYLFDDEPRKLLSYLEIDGRFETDRHGSAIMVFGADKTATFICHTQLSEFQKVTILGSSGRVEMNTPFIVEPEEPAVLQVYSGTKAETITLDPCNQYSLQFEQFVRSIFDQNSMPIPLQDSVNNMKVLDAVVKSAKSGTWQFLETTQRNDT